MKVPCRNSMSPRLEPSLEFGPGAATLAVCWPRCQPRLFVAAFVLLSAGSAFAAPLFCFVALHLEPSLETDFSGDVLVSWGVCDAFWTCETEFRQKLSVHESDLERYVLETTFLWSMVEAQLDRHVLEFLDDGCSVA